MQPKHPAWEPTEPEWVNLAPGVRWLLRRPDGADKMIVASDVSQAMSRIYQGRAELEALGLEPEMQNADHVLSLDQIVGYSSLLTANRYAQRCLVDWEGMDHPKTGEKIDFADPSAVHDALVFGAPETNTPLLTPFLAWIDQPKRPMGAETVRLRALAKDHWTGGAERCRTCADESDPCAKGGSIEGQICPRLKNTPQTPEGTAAWEIASSTAGMWDRAGMAGTVTGFHYREALLVFETNYAGDGSQLDFGAAFAAFRAIEAGRLEAEAEQAKSDSPPES